MSDVVKCSYIKRHSKSFLSGGWNKSFLALHRDSHLYVYKKQGDSTPQGSIFMKDVCKHFAYGEYTNGMPDRPELPSGISLDCLMGIPQKPNSKAKIHWFLFNSPSELHEWMTAICSVLPPLPSKESGVPHVSHHAQQASAHPQPVVPGPPPPPMGAPPALGFENLTLGGGPPPPAAYQPAPYSHAGAPYHPQQYPHQYPQTPQIPPGSYPQQQYHPQVPAPAYPQQSYHYQHPPGQVGTYHQQPVQYVQGYPQQAYGYQQQPAVVYHTQPVQVVHKHKSGGSNMGKMAAGVAGGALLGYGASRMMGGGGWGLGRWGSWSSLSSFGSFGSCGSFGSFGSFG